MGLWLSCSSSYTFCLPYSNNNPNHTDINSCCSSSFQQNTYQTVWSSSCHICCQISKNIQQNSCIQWYSPISTRPNSHPPSSRSSSHISDPSFSRRNCLCTNTPQDSMGWSWWQTCLFGLNSSSHISNLLPSKSWVHTCRHWHLWRWLIQ